ncbi:MAG: hypothetical protein LBB53_01065 [Prevotellaceae bacterium]|jgi:hypothetical protein|nr:hypothetical protein [Prevotellaceae bacterium]
MRESKTMSNRYDGYNFEEEKKLRKTLGLAKFSGSFFDTTEVALTKTVSFSNTAEVSKKIAIFPANMLSVAEIAVVAGMTVDGIAGSTITGITEVSEGMQYAQRHYVRNPTRVTEIQVSVNNQAQLALPIEVKMVSPHRSLESIKIYPKQHQRASDSNVNLVSIPTNGLQIDDQTIWVVTVGAGKTIDLTFFVGASRNDALLLKRAGEAFAQGAE